ncbi:MAG TPA: ScyD/ScyE family protein [Ktedonobacterales bacterium]
MGNVRRCPALAFHDAFYMGNLGHFPVVPGSSNLYRITPGGQIGVAVQDLTTVLGLAFDRQGRLYALESDTVAGFPGPAAAGSGTVVRVNKDGSLTTIASGLVFPTAMTFGLDGALYVSNFGFGVPVLGAGQIVRISLSD